MREAVIIGQMSKQRKSGKAGQPRRHKPKSRTPLERLTANFLACHRCDQFLGGYRARVGEETLAAQVAAGGAGWLRLTMDDEVRRLAAGAYGYRISADSVHFEGRCSVCGRVFVLEMDEEAQLLIQATPNLVEQEA